jgi:hypothetical protein
LGFSGDNTGSIGVVGLSLGVVGSAEETTAEGTTMEWPDAVFESIMKVICLLSKLFLAASYVRALL